MNTIARWLGRAAAASRLTLLAGAALLPAPAFAEATGDAAVPKLRLAPAIEAFFGGLRGDYVAGSPRVTRQFEAVFFATRPAVAWADGYGLLANANRHDPPELAALAMDTDGSIKAAALVGFHCRSEATAPGRHRGPPRTACANDPLHPALDIFLYDRRDSERVVNALCDWARQAEIKLRTRKPWPAQLHVQVQYLQVVRAP